MGTLIGCAEQGGMLDEDGKLRNTTGAMMADAIATAVGAFFGTSTTTTFVESASGVAVGGRTGLTALTVSVLFAISSFFAPIFTSIPSFATAPALMMVGFLMVSNVVKIKLDKSEFITEGLPILLCSVGMLVFYSIAEGIVFGVVSYVALNFTCGKKEKLNAIMVVLAILFVAKHVFL